MALALLLPVGDAPWFSFWREWAASIAVLLIVVSMLSAIRNHGLVLRAKQPVACVAVVLATLSALQYATGLLTYRSDALLTSLYLLTFALCVIVAGSLTGMRREQLADRLAASFMFAAFVSAPLAVLQWMGWLRLDLGMPVAGGRPVAHMEQANLLCSLEMLGALGAWRLAERRSLSTAAARLIIGPMLVAAALTQSRVAWLVAMALVGVAWWRRDLLSARQHKVLVATVGAVVLFEWLLPSVSGSFGLSSPALEERFSEGRRPAVWLLFTHATLEHPWLGWGALQNGSAQFAISNMRPALGYFFSSAHNVIIDLVVWFGIPAGLLAGLVLIWAIVRSIAQSATLAALLTAAAAMVLVLHSLVELPLHYAYFLFPLGLWLGSSATARPLDSPAKRSGSSGNAFILTVAVLGTWVLAVLAQDYIAIKDNRPILAVDKATLHLKLEAYGATPDVVLLDQLKAFHAFAALPLGDMPVLPAELDAAKEAMVRSPYAASLERYALLAGLNGRPEEARDTLIRVCKFEPQDQCAATVDAWLRWRQAWPRLPMWPIVDAAN